MCHFFVLAVKRIVKTGPFISGNDTSFSAAPDALVKGIGMTYFSGGIFIIAVAVIAIILFRL